MNIYEEAATTRASVARALAKSLAARLRKEFPGRKVTIGGYCNEEGRNISLDIFPREQEYGGRVQLSILDAGRYPRANPSSVPEHLKLDAGYGGTHATYRLNDGELPTKAMTKMLARIREHIEGKVSARERSLEAATQGAKATNEARVELMRHGYIVSGGKLQRRDEEFYFTAKKEEQTVEVVGSWANKVKVSLQYDHNTYDCRPISAAAFCDVLVAHANTMDALEEEEADSA